MQRLTTAAGIALFAVAVLGEHVHLGGSEQRGSSAAQRIDLAERLQAGKLRGVNRDATRLQGSRDGVHVSEREGPGVVWIEGTDFAEGTIQLDVRGRDVPQRSFVGVAFHGRGDNAYEAVYLRPFNFRNPDAARRQNAVQYMMLPDYDWPRLRKEFPSEFENPVDPSIVPTERSAMPPKRGLSSQMMTRAPEAWAASAAARPAIPAPMTSTSQWACICS